jgi:hypothetical protein
MIVSSVFVLCVIALCWFKPNAARVFLGFFFLLMALAVNGSFTLTNPQAFLDYAQGSPIPLYRDLASSVMSLNLVLFGLLLMAFEITMGLLLLHKEKFVTLGLIGTMIFVIGISPLGIIQLPWLGLVIGELHLLTKKFDTSLLEIVLSKLRPHPA